ncbi:MAG TPA: thiamine pyrophosphate-dependent enzyme, partial [Thermomicrobiales bacterium]|nr:thiamine pyrophosphate-dependent enzyme [Thermomicrobiales bacterium]
MAQLTGGQALAQSLAREGVDTIFGLPGAQLDWAFDALHEVRDRIRVVHTRHEQATSYMADGYARATGKVGACLVVPGPGVLNAGAGLATAYACSSPVLCLAGQIDSRLIGGMRGELHEIKDQRAVLDAVTKWTGRALSPGDVPGLVREAFAQLRSGRPAPVGLEIPPDVLRQTAEVALLDPRPVERQPADPTLIEQAAELLAGAERPAFYVGSGVLAAGAWEELRAVAEALGAPVVMSRNGRGALSARHPLALNPVAGLEALPAADLVVAVGTRFLEPATGWDLPAGLRVIQIDVAPDEVGRNVAPAVGIVADAKLALAALRDALDGAMLRGTWRPADIAAIRERADDTLFELQPQAAFAGAIRAALPDDGVYVCDVNQVSYWSWVGFPVYEPRTFLTSGYQGTLGAGYATALGAQVGRPERKVVAVLGDGGFGYALQELATAKAHRINAVAVVFDDGAYGNVKRMQREQFEGRTIASDLTNPDWPLLARSFGVAGLRATTPDELEGTLREAFATDAPALIAVPVGEMPSPWRLIFPRYFRA